MSKRRNVKIQTIHLLMLFQSSRCRVKFGIVRKIFISSELLVSQIMACPCIMFIGYYILRLFVIHPGPLVNPNLTMHN